MLYILNLHHVICQLYLNKAGKKLNKVVKYMAEKDKLTKMKHKSEKTGMKCGIGGGIINWNIKKRPH